MRKALILAITLLSLNSQAAFAWVGGPWSGNSHNGDNSGTYQAIITGKNLSGMARFSEGSEAQISVFNVSTLYYKGVVYFGSCFGIIDTVNKKVNGITSGSFNEFQTTTRNSGVSSSSSTTLLGGGGGGTAGGGGQTIAATGSGAVGTAGVVGTGNTSWNGKITSTAPVIEFKASGTATFFGELDTKNITTTKIRNEPPREYDVEIDPITGQLTGGTPFVIQVIANSLTGGAILSAFQNVSIQELIQLLDLSTTRADSSVDTTASTGGQDHIFPDLGVTISIDVYGNRLTYGRQAPLIPAQDGLSGSGGGGFLF